MPFGCSPKHRDPKAGKGGETQSDIVRRKNELNSTYKKVAGVEALSAGIGDALVEQQQETDKEVKGATAKPEGNNDIASENIPKVGDKGNQPVINSDGGMATGLVAEEAEPVVSDKVIDTNGNEVKSCHWANLLFCRSTQLFISVVV